MKEQVAAVLLGPLLLTPIGCSKPAPRPLRSDRQPPVYQRPGERNAPWLTLDIDTDNAVRYRNAVLFDPAVDDAIVLARALKSLREQALRQGVIRLYAPPPVPAPTSLDDPIAPVLPGFAAEVPPWVRDPVRIEAHRWSLWAAMDQLMHTSRQPDIGFFALQLALLDVPD